MGKIDPAHRLPNICRKCFYRRYLYDRGFSFYTGDSRTESCCAFLHLEDEQRGCTPTDGECKRFKPRTQTKSLSGKITMIK